MPFVTPSRSIECADREWTRLETRRKIKLKGSVKGVKRERERERLRDRSVTLSFPFIAEPSSARRVTVNNFHPRSFSATPELPRPKPHPFTLLFPLLSCPRRSSYALRIQIYFIQRFKSSRRTQGTDFCSSDHSNSPSHCTLPTILHVSD